VERCWVRGRTPLERGCCQDCTHRLRRALLYGTQLLLDDETVPTNRGSLVVCREARRAYA
jgi:hypothetical protein